MGEDRAVVGTFGDLLRSQREAAALTRQELAEKADLTESTVRNLETGRHQPRLSNARRLADALGLQGPDRDRFIAVARNVAVQWTNAEGRDTEAPNEARDGKAPALEGRGGEAPDPDGRDGPALAVEHRGDAVAATAHVSGAREELTETRHAPEQPLAGAARGRWRTALASAAVVVVVIGAVFFAQRVATEEEIKQVILEATAVELGWYKQPREDRRGELPRYFQPPDQGGDRLPRIERTISRLNEQNRRFAEDASRAVSVEKVALHLDGRTATAETHEIWFQPLVEFVDGVERRIPPEQLSPHPVYTDGRQRYMLRKDAGRWYIQSNPVP